MFLQIKQFVESTLSKGPKGLVAEFKKVPKHDDLAAMTEFVAQNAWKKNRYKVRCVQGIQFPPVITPVLYLRRDGWHSYPFFVPLGGTASRFYPTVSKHNLTEFSVAVFAESRRLREGRGAARSAAADLVWSRTFHRRDESCCYALFELIPHERISRSGWEFFVRLKSDTSCVLKHYAWTDKDGYQLG